MLTVSNQIKKSNRLFGIAAINAGFSADN